MSEFPQEQVETPDIDLESLSDAQKSFFEETQATFPEVKPKLVEEDGTVLFHGLGFICRIDPAGGLEITEEHAPDCPNCATEIMNKIDQGQIIAQCHSCGNFVRDISPYGSD